MDFKTVFLSILASAGGIGAVVWILVKTLSKYVVEDLNKKYQQHLDKELESYKKELEYANAKKESVLSNKIYISKTKFDEEFSIYRSLSESFMKMVKHCSFLFTDENFYFDGKRPNEFWIRKSINAIKSVDRAQDILFQNAPFISKEIYYGFEQILYQCQDIVLSLEPLAHASDPKWESLDLQEFIEANKEKIKSILENQDSLFEKLRMYLDCMDTIEN